MKFFIWAPDYRENCVGIRALHVLCDILRRKCLQEAFLVNCSVTNPAFDTPIAAKVTPDGIVVYPDIVHGNPLNAEKITWWLLAPAQPRDGLIFAWDKKQNPSVKDTLYVPILQRELFAWTARRLHGVVATYKAPAPSGMKVFKYALEEVQPDLTDRGKNGELCVEITDQRPSTREGLSWLLRSVDYLICGEDMTLLTSEARWCGCPVLTTVPKEDYRDGFLNGIAFHYQDLPEARSALPLFRQKWWKYEAGSSSTVESFLARCREYWDGSL